MFCPKCGNELPEGAIHCNKCGYKVVKGEQTTATSEPNMQYQTNNFQQPVQPKKKKGLWKKILIGVGIALVVLFVIGMFSGESGSSSDKYVQMVKTGYPVNYPNSTYGKAFGDFFSNPKWKHFKSTEGDEVVEFQGGCTYNDADVTVTLQFMVDEDAGTFETGYFDMNGVPQNQLFTAALIDRVFGGDGTEDDNEKTTNTSTASADEETDQTNENVQKSSEEVVDEFHPLDTVLGTHITTVVNYVFVDKSFGNNVHCNCTITNSSNDQLTFSTNDYFSLNNNGLIMSGSCDYDYQTLTAGTSFTTDLIFVCPDNANQNISLMTLTADGYDISLSDRVQSEDMAKEFVGTYIKDNRDTNKFIISSLGGNQYSLIHIYYIWDEHYIDYWTVTLNSDNSFAIGGADYYTFVPDSYCITAPSSMTSDMEVWSKCGYQGYYVETDAEEVEEEGDVMGPVDTYIIPGSDSRVIEPSDYQNLDSEQMRYALNEIYARHGRKFKDSALQSYFDSKSWYVGTVEPDNFTEDMLNDYERENVQILQNYM